MKDKEAYNLLVECLRDYAMPILIVGLNDINESDYVTVISATCPKEEFTIVNNKRPKWYSNVIDNSLKKTNILFITDFDEISIEEQKLFVDIICKNTISSEKLPDNLEIVVCGKEKFPVLPEIMENVQYIENKE